MMRVLLLSLLNFMLPFLFWWLWQLFLSWRDYQRYKNDPHVIDVTPEPRRKTWPVFKLILAGIVLLLLSLFVWRFVSTEYNDWDSANQPVSKEYGW